ncbi:MAG: recombinase RecJ [Halobacteria archaeon]|nr:recombinase RecJ [Halobacteria archaeon]
MEDSLIEDDELSLKERSVLPKAEFFVLDSVREERKESKLSESVAGRDVVMLVDGDADGLAAVALAREVYDDVGYFDTSPNSLRDSIEKFAEKVEEGVEVFVVDLCLDDVEGVEDELRGIVERASEAHWYDHHQWDDDTVDDLGAMGYDIVIGESDEVCSADVTLDEFERMGHSFDDEMVELVKVTRDHDLWINDDPRSEDLADLSVYLSADEYLDIIEDGVDFDDETLDFLAEKREEKENLIELAVERADFYEVAGFEIAQTYGRCSQNEVAEELRERGADAVTVVKPEGGMSLRGSDSFERCHKVARELGGGGHPRAAGCKPDVFDTMLDYAEHWVSRGEPAHEEALEAFESVLDTA